MDVERMLTEYDVKEVRRRWAFARDHGEWETMRACFHSDSTVSVSWYSGPASTFFERTIAMAKERRPEERSKHFIGNARAFIKGERAILETDAMVLGRNFVEGHLFDFTFYLRFYDRLERRQGVWRILRMTAIYDKDRVEPVIPGSVPASFFASAKLEGPESAIGLARLLNEKRGRPMPPVVIGGTDGELKLRAEAEAWLG